MRDLSLKSASNRIGYGSHPNNIEKKLNIGYNRYMDNIKKRRKGRVLTPKQLLFTAEYIKDFNGKSAAIRAGYSPRTAKETASRLLTNVNIYKVIRRNMDQRLEKARIEADYVLQRLVAIDRMSIDQILNDDFSVKPLSEWPQIWLEMLAGLDVKELHEGRGDAREMAGALKKLKWPDKLKTLELIGKHIDVRAFAEQHKHSHGLPDETIRTLRDVLKGTRRKEIMHQ